MKESTQPNVRTASEESPMRFLIAGRLCVACLALISSSVSTLSNPDRSNDFFHIVSLPIALIFAVCGISAVYLKSHAPGAIFKTTQIVADVLAVTGIVYVSGGLISPFLVLYVPLVMSVSLTCSRNWAIFASFLSAICYGLLAYGLTSLSIPTAFANDVVQMPPNGLGLQIVGLLSGMVLVSIATGYISRELKKSDSLVEQSRREFSALEGRQQALIDGIGNGVVTTLPDGTITTINKSAAKILSLDAEKNIGDSLQETLRHLSIGFVLPSYQSPSFSTPREVEVLTGFAKKDVTRISYYGRTVRGELGEVTGLLFIFEDVTVLRSFEEQLALHDKMSQLLIEENKPIELTGLDPGPFVGESPLIKKTVALIHRVAPTDSTVLICGESGTGKELVAKLIHERSRRSEERFIAVNCGAIPSELLESELFGHKKGAFTSAFQDAPGLIRSAHGGTLFLDEIGELPLSMQAKLLRTLQERVVRPVGSEKDYSVDVRIIAATNRDLRKEMAAGTFREDLFYRLNVINVTTPPLRERKEDLPRLVKVFASSFGKREGRAPSIHPDCMKLFMNYSYPGNVRELENIVERAVVLGGDMILPEHLPELVSSFKSNGHFSNGVVERPLHDTTIIEDDSINFPMDLDSFLGDIEKRYLLRALEETNGARKKAATLLGMNFRSLRYRLQKFGIGEEDT